MKIQFWVFLLEVRERRTVKGGQGGATSRSKVSEQPGLESLVSQKLTEESFSFKCRREERIQWVK